MSAFVVIYDRSNMPLQAGILERAMERMKHRGPDGSDVWTSRNISMGHWHFWTTPEEVDERQPLNVAGLPFTVVLDGRLDNRPELFSQLKISPADNMHYSDAALALSAYAKWGSNCFEHFVGEFALVIFDPQKGELVCARDQLGERTLFYAFYGTQCVIASEPWAVTGATNMAVEINEKAVAHYFAFKATEETFFGQVYELLPAHRMIVNNLGHRIQNYWELDSAFRLPTTSSEEYAEQFRSLLQESVRCRMRSTTAVGVMMSGGFDSTSVACLAADLISPRQLTTLSFVFDELTECDERKYIRAMTERWALRSIQIPCDDAWPLRDWPGRWKPNPNQPDISLYRLLHERIYDRARQEGMRVLLTGSAGDLIYSDSAYWFTDLFSDGQPRKAIEELVYHVREKGIRQTLKSKYLRCAGRWALNRLPGGKYIHRAPGVSAWLTPFALDTLDSSDEAREPERSADLLGLRVAQLYSRAAFDHRLYALDLRHPYRDRRLVEFVLGLPAYQLYHRGLKKYILRNAMQGLLPDEIRMWRGKIHLGPLFFRGIEREKDVLLNCIQKSESTWSRFVNSDWLDKYCNIIGQKSDAEALVPWLIISFDEWNKFVNAAAA